MDDKEKIFEELRQGLKVYDEYHKSDGYYGAIPPAKDLEYANVTVGGLNTTYTLSSLELNNLATSTISISPTWTSGANGGNFSWSNTQPSASVTDSGKISLQGENADIEINGESLMTMLHRIEERLNILTPNQKLEAEWDQLRELGKQYRELEKKLTEQSKMWDTLKKMPPPETK